MSAAQQLLQARIDAQQSLDTIEYGLRSIKACGGASHCTGPHAGQLTRARYEAARVLGRGYISAVTGGSAVQLDNGCATLLRTARDEARTALKDAKAALKETGGLRQLRLALAAGDEIRELALAA